MTLRLLHTSDWHLGHTLHGFDRLPEHQRLLEWLLQTLEEEAIDALLIAGDVFDAANPPTEAQALWYQFLVEAWRRMPRLQVVVVGGNHDSASRLNLSDPFLKALLRLHVVGGVTRHQGELELDRLVIPLQDSVGQVAAWVAAVPFLRASETGAGGEDAVAAGTRRLYQAVLERARALRTPGQALLAMGHLYLVGTRVSELSERKLVVGHQSAVPVDVFPDDLAYAALGHLHLAQAVGGNEHVRYAGSPLPLSLPERSYPHSVVVLEVEGMAVSSLRTLPTPRFVELLRIPKGEGFASAEEALREIRALPKRGEGAEGSRPLVEVCVRLDAPEPSLRQQVESALEGKEPRLIRLGVELAGSGAGLGDVETRPIAELSPEEVFRKKYARDYGAEPDGELLSAFQELLEQVRQVAP